MESASKKFENNEVFGASLQKLFVFLQKIKEGLAAMNKIRFNPQDNFIERKEPMSRLMAFKDTRLIKVITGVRRCGKSTLLQMFRDKLVNAGVDPDNILNVNFEDFSNYELRDPMKLHSFVMSHIEKGHKSYLFLDEIQHVERFPDVLNSLALNENLDIYVTGSNAYMLSGEIATYISGRYVEIKMLPLSFKEFCSELTDNESIASRFQKYIKVSGFPYASFLGDDESMIRDYLSGVYSTIILKDIMSRGRIDGSQSLERIVKYTFDNIGNSMSLKRIADILTSTGYKIDSKTVDRYMTLLTQSYIIYEVSRLDLKGGELLKTQNKFYVVDCALRNYLLGLSPRDRGHILENVVYLELLRRYQEVYIGKVGDMEIDFVAVKDGRREYFQVTQTLASEETFDREIKPLRALSDSYPKNILTTDEFGLGNIDGVEVRNVFDWLIG